jgi:CheY-like chemotaxis protein
MALNGRLEDMNLLEILQIVSFSRKTGALEVRGQEASGSVLFRRGRLLCASSTSTSDGVRSLAGRPLDSEGKALLASFIRSSLRELVALREGRFEFRLFRTLPPQWGGFDASSFLHGEGVDPQEILLELAREIDEARDDSSLLLEASGTIDEVSAAEDTSDAVPLAESDSLPEAGLTVVIVDDEPLVVQIVGQEMDEAGCVVESASGPAEALEVISALLSRAPSSLVVVTDAGMPASTGDGFDGGFELVERLRDIGGGPEAAPIVLMAESLSTEARARARSLGIQKIAFKPTLTKLDPEEYGADLRKFARALRREIAELAQSARDPWTGPPEPDKDPESIFDFLKTMTDQLSAPASGITRIILQVASRYVERAILFLVKNGRASGLAGTERGRPTALVVGEVRAISFELQHVESFAEVVYSRSPVRIREAREPLLPALDPGRSREQALFPLLHNHEVLAVLYCDNPTTGAPLPRLTGLSLFLVQAGMALENASLHRRLQSLETRYSLDNQGPLTQELAPIARSGR